MEKFFLIINLSTLIYALLANKEKVQASKQMILECATKCVGKTKYFLSWNTSDIPANVFESITNSLLTIVTQTKSKNKLPKDCAEVIINGDCSSGVKTIYPFHCSKRPVQVYCDQASDGGGWTVFQNRDESLTWEDFNRTYEDYVSGFGNRGGEFWLGLDNIRALTRSIPTELRVDMEDYEGNKYSFFYPNFKIGDSSSKYRLEIEGTRDSQYPPRHYEDSLVQHNRLSFVTNELQKKSKDVICSSSIIYRGPWWNKEDGSNCPSSNLNGHHDDYDYRIHGEGLSSGSYAPYKHQRYPYEYRDGIIWRPLRPIKRASMKIRMKGF